MKKSSLKVALNMSTLPVPEKIKKATAVVNALTNNADTFATPDPDLKSISTAIDDLQEAYLATADGGKSKTAAMHNMEDELMLLMRQLAAYVEQVADGDESIMKLSGFDVKKRGTFNKAEISLISSGHGQVTLQVKAHRNTIYKWQYTADNGTSALSWTDALRNRFSKATIQGLSSGSYLFRVIFIDDSGEYAGNSLRVAVN